MILCVLRNPQHQIDTATNDATLGQVDMSTPCIYITNVKSSMINEVVVKGMTCLLGSKPSLNADVCVCNHEPNGSLGCFARVLMTYKGAWNSTLLGSCNEKRCRCTPTGTLRAHGCCMSRERQACKQTGNECIQFSGLNPKP